MAEEEKEINTKVRLFKVVTLFLMIALFEAIWSILFISKSVEVALVWIGVSIMILVIICLISLTWAIRGNFNFISVLSEPSEPKKIDPLVAFKATKLLDKYEINIHFKNTYENCCTDIAGIEKIKNALLDPETRFINIKDLYYEDKIADKWISINNISYVDEERQQDIRRSHSGIYSEDTKKEMSDLVKQGYVIEEITAANDEAKEIVEKLKKKFNK